MRVLELQELIEIYNELEPNKNRCIDVNEIMANIVDPHNYKEIEFFINIIIKRIDNVGVMSNDEQE